METTMFLYTQNAPLFLHKSPPPTTIHRCGHHHRNVHHRPYLAMALRDLTIRRITANRNNFRFNQATKSLSIAEQHTSINHRAMAEERKNGNVSLEKKVDTMVLSISKSAHEKENAAEKSTPPVLPPEKPLPGDCCDSGCVRCVWDVFFEKLEECNKLQKADYKIS